MGVSMQTVKKKTSWQLQEAKAQFSQVIRNASVSPQIITVRGEETAVILSAEQYNKLIRPKMDLVEFFQNSPLADAEIDLKRDKSANMRAINL
jgi:prevent-host-death family protein